MKKILLISALTVNLIAFKAQTLPLNTYLNNIPANAHVKDMNNELNPYIGVYKANYQGSEITLYITKVEDKLENSAPKSYYMDALIVKYIVKNSSGTILQDTQNISDLRNKISSYRIKASNNSVILYYSGTHCGVGWGDIYLKKINATQISWEYRPEDMVLTSENCIGNPDITIYLPETKDLIFTKQ